MASSAVDIFLVISGYFMCTSYKRTLGKPFSLVLQVCIFNELAYLVEVACGLWPLSLRSIFSSFIPDSYYTTLFVVVYFISPYINRLMNNMQQKDLNLFVCLMFMLFSVLSLPSLLLGEATDIKWMGLNTIGAWGSQQGFNIVNFLLCYIIGAYLRLGNLPEWVKHQRNQLMIIILIILILFGWSLVNKYILYKQGMWSSWVYDNPLVILYGVLLFMIFKELHFTSTFINNVSKAVYATFLIHCTVMEYANVEHFCVQPWYIFVGYFLCFALIMISVSWVIMKLYDLFTKSIIKKLDKITVIDCFQ